MQDVGELKAAEAERIEFEKSLSSAYYPSYSNEPVYRPYVPKNHSIAQLNKNTGLPHEHKREIARRLRQQDQK